MARREPRPATNRFRWREKRKCLARSVSKGASVAPKRARASAGKSKSKAQTRIPVAPSSQLEGGKGQLRSAGFAPAEAPGMASAHGTAPAPVGQVMLAGWRGKLVDIKGSAIGRPDLFVNVDTRATITGCG